MASNLKLSQTIRHAMLNQITSTVGGSGLWRIYAGSQPAGPDTTNSATVLAELVCGSTFAPAASSNTLTLNAITQDSSANNTGTAAWWRISSSGSAATAAGHIDGTCGTSDADLILNSTAITAGAVVQISSATFTAGNA